MNPVIRASTAFLLTAVVSSTSVMTGCNSAKANPPPNSDAAQTAGPAQSVPASAPAPQMSLDDVVAPIALYPDQLLAQILTASTNAQEVLDGGNWLLQNLSLRGDALTNAAKQAGFSPSMQYLMTFPQVLDNMCQQVDWTRELGQDFQADQKGVMDAVQRKRAQAQNTGNLKSSPQMTVDTKQADNGQPYVEIKPADPQVVYVPQYNPVTIYNTPAPAAAVTTNTTEQAQSGVSTGTAVAIGLLSFGVGMAVGSAIHRDDYYPYPSWGSRGVYYGGRPYYPPPYRPVYPGYRPAYGYHPPSNYHWNQYNRQVNVNVNNNNYYGRFNSNTVRNNMNVNNRPGLGGGNQGLAANNNRPDQPNWKGQSTYQGARPNIANQRPGAAMANANPRNQQMPNRPTPGNNVALANRPSVGNNAAAPNRPNLSSNPGINATNRPAAANASSVNRPNPGNAGSMNRAAAASPPNLNRGGDRGFGNSGSRPGGGAAPTARPALQQNAGPQNRAAAGNSAFNRGGSPKAERAASNRGQASMGGRGGGPRGNKR